jgi:hypothetical protein
VVAAPGRSGYEQPQVRHGEGRLVDTAAVAQRLSGSVKLLFDTLTWPPGARRVQGTHQAGWCHAGAARPPGTLRQNRAAFRPWRLPAA